MLLNVIPEMWFTARYQSWSLWVAA